MRATSEAHPNIALVKYWGKRDASVNLPAVGSLSVTLDALWTRMTVEFRDAEGEDRLQVNGRPAAGMRSRVSECLDAIAGPGRFAATVVSECNFPIAAGLASSASAFSALVMAASKANGRSLEPLTLARIAGRASGSAARSLYPGIVELTPGDRDIDVVTLAAPHEWPLSVTVAVTDTAAKAVSSGTAMTISKQTSPFYGAWVERQPQDLDIARSAVRNRDFAALAGIAEHNCLKMHSVMWSSRPAIVYWNAATLACLETVRDLQRQGVPVFFTIDAGPQVKAVALPHAGDTVAEALRGTPGVMDVLQSGLGQGARLLELH
jgi:diphosphomevalonate decarboxylase